MKNIILKSSLLILGLCVSTSIIARDYTISQITDNNIDESLPRLNEAGDVLWASWVNATDIGWTISLYDSSTQNSWAISDGNVFYDSHQFNIHGDAVWIGTDANGISQIHLYKASTNITTQLTSGDLHQTSPQISDNGDVAWLEQRGSTASSAGLMRHDADTMETDEIVFPGATRQGLISMNTGGDIAWNATVNGAAQDVLLYSASTGVTTNLSGDLNALDSNQRLLDNGDVLWRSEVYSTPGLHIFRHYKAATGNIVDVEVVGEPLFGPMGHAAWSTTTINGASTTYTISAYDPMSGAVNVISNESFTDFGVFAPGIRDISARGDVIWHQIVQTNRFYRLYDAPSGNIFDIATNPFDFYLADNGDIITSEWDGNDYEVYTDPAAGGGTVQLTNDFVDSGVTQDNASGSVLWNRWDFTDNELFVATKNPLSLSIDDVEVEFEKGDREGAWIKLKFASDGEPDYFENISVKINGITILNSKFGDFEMTDYGKFTFKADGVRARLNFNRGKMRVSSKHFDPELVKSHKTIVEVSFGAATAKAKVKKARPHHDD